MRSYLASLPLKCKSSNKETTAGNTLLLPTSSPGRFSLALGEKRPGDEVVLLLVLIVGNRIILRSSSVVGVGVSKLVPFSDLFLPFLSLPPPFYAFPSLGILVLGCNQCPRTILNGDEGLDLTHSWEYVTTWGRLLEAWLALTVG